MSNTNDYSISDLVTLDSAFFDLYALASRIERHFSDCLTPLPARVYVGSCLEGLDLSTGRYVTRKGKVDKVVSYIEEITSPLYLVHTPGDIEKKQYDEKGCYKLVLSQWHIDQKDFSSTPKLPKRGIQILRDLIDHSLDNFLPYRRAVSLNKLLRKHFTYTASTHPALFATADEEELVDLFNTYDKAATDLTALSQSLLDDIHKFIGRYTEHLYFLEVKQSYIHIHRSIDHRAWAYMREQMDKAESCD
jgi:hypothetical protein